MFLRSTRRIKDGKEHRYWSIVENRRCAGGKVAQRPVLYLGEINDSQREAWCRVLEGFDEDERCERQMALFAWDREIPGHAADIGIGVRLKDFSLHRPRQWGACWLACELYRQLGLVATPGSGPSVSLAWTDNATNETGYIVERRTGSAAFALLENIGPNSTSYSDNSVLAGTTYSYRVVSVNSAGSTPSAEVSVTVPAAGPTFEGWIGVYSSLSGNEALHGADPDRDGIANFLEYALGGSPVANSRSQLPEMAMEAGRLQLSFERTADPTLVYTVEGSNNLRDWNPVWSSTGTSNTSGPVTVQDTETPGTSPRFLRLKVDRN